MYQKTLSYTTTRSLNGSDDISTDIPANYDVKEFIGTFSYTYQGVNYKYDTRYVHYEKQGSANLITTSAGNATATMTIEATFKYTKTSS